VSGAGSAGTAGFGNAAGTSAGAGGDTSPPDPGPQVTSGKLDLLLAIDNSTSTADKQQLLVASLPNLLARLANPLCVDTQGVAASTQPANANVNCPTGTSREFAPMRDMHIGVITSSLGSHGGDVCNTATNGDDKGQLLPSVRTGLTSYNGQGYLNWDPDGHSTPPGETNINTLTSDLSTMLAAVGQVGCGYEAQLESIYRFLVDPSPPQSVDIMNNVTTPEGINTTLLAQRASFLRPDSAVAVVMLTDENDCSIADSGFGWFISTRALNGADNRMYRATTICDSDPNSPCCKSCGDTSAVPAQCGFSSSAPDPSCQLDGGYLTVQDDSVALRCWDQKRRFGFDLLQPLSRYVNGFAGAKVPDRSGNLVDNPLFHQGSSTRAPTLFTFSVIAGVPWQDLATPASLTGNTLDYLPADQLATRWSAIDGDPTRYVAPTDPFMVETTADRTTLPIAQQNPFSTNTLAPDTSQNPKANAINGHEQNVAELDDLQYACIFPLPSPKTCTQGTTECDCSPSVNGDTTAITTYNSPVCNPPGGGAPTPTQNYAKAYPALRELWVASQLGSRSVVSSICARNTSDNTRSDYAYQPAFASIGRRVAATLAPATP
jgi:hypothetical protein